MKLLICWIGKSDIDACDGKPNSGQGPIGQAVLAETYARIVLLSDWDQKTPGTSKRYCAWLKELVDVPIDVKLHQLTGPTDFQEIYQAADADLAALKASFGDKLDLTMHISPGTAQMAAIWIILAKTRYPARLIESSKEGGVREAIVPFDLSAEFLPALRKKAGERLVGMIDDHITSPPSFAAIIHKSSEMKRCIDLASRISPYPIPVLIEGESGTGKELMAHAIHQASGRAGKLVSVNCGAIPLELVESEFFGHGKGSFSGASSERKGHFEVADGGTLFLDEIGELPKSVQVKLLRALQEGMVVRVGTSKEISVDVRIITATNRNLVKEVADGNFREDLFYRLAVGMIRLPPLRERRGDLGVLIDHLIARIVEKAPRELMVKHKRISAGARNILLSHSWPGNIRELFNTLQRAVVWSEGESIDADLVNAVMLSGPTIRPVGDDVLNLPIDDGVDLEESIARVARHYIERALVHTKGNKTQAAKLLSFGSYQRLNDWMKRYSIKE